jgi:membrane dipeptidase
MSDSVRFFDGHNDVLLHLYRRDPSGRAFFDGLESGHIDYARARAGGFAGGFFAVFVPSLPDERAPDGPPAGALELGYAQRLALEIMAVLFRLERASDGELRVVRTIDELVGALRHDVIASILHFEGAEAIDPKLASLETFYNAGLRSLGPVWSRPNAFAEGVPFAFPRSPDTGPGLTDAGRALVHACNELGIMLDLSHINERGFRDVAAISRAPLVATHSNAHALCPATRNLTDYQLDAIRDSGGVVGLNFGVCFLRDDGGDDPDVPLDVMIRQIDYMVERMGIEHVAFGSDFDGVTIPTELGDVAGVPRLIRRLGECGYDDEAIRMIARENWVRVLSETWVG